MQKPNILKKRLKDGKTVFGPWCIIPSPMLTNIIAAAGADFAIFDLEHGAIGYETLDNMIRAADSEDCTPLVRVGKRDELLVLKALDLGAHGVIIPHVEKKSDCQEAVSFVKYHPSGKRGFSPFTRAGGFSMINIAKHADKVNKETLTAVILEGKEGINNIDEILETPHLDLVYIGAYDLSQALGIPGKVDDTKVISLMEACVKKIRDKGIASGGYVARNTEDMKFMVGMGMQFITYVPDVTAIYNTFYDAMNDFKSVLKEVKR